MLLGVVLILRCFIWRCRAFLILFSRCRYWRRSWHFFYVPGFSSPHFFSQIQLYAWWETMEIAEVLGLQSMHLVDKWPTLQIDHVPINSWPIRPYWDYAKLINDCSTVQWCKLAESDYRKVQMAPLQSELLLDQSQRASTLDEYSVQVQKS